METWEELERKKFRKFRAQFHFLKSGKIIECLDCFLSCLCCWCGDDMSDGENTLLLEGSVHPQEDHSRIKASSRGIAVVNVTKHVTIYAASYYKKFKSTERVFFRFSDPVKILPSQTIRIPKTSCTCKHSYGARVFFSSTLEVLRETIAKDFYDRIGSHSASLTRKVIVAIEDELLQGYKPHAWSLAERRARKLPESNLRVRSAFDVPPTNPNQWDLDISDEEDSQQDTEEAHVEFEGDIEVITTNDNEGTSFDILEEPNHQTIDCGSHITRTSSLPVLPPNAKVYNPPRRCSLSNTEKEVLKKRSMKCKEGLLRYIPELEGIQPKNSEDSFPSVALCLSGGSYRSLVASIGALQSIRDTGLLDCITYISCLSGTIWSVGMWYSFPDQDLDALLQRLPSLMGETSHSFLKSGEVWSAYRELQRQKKSVGMPRTRLSDLYATCIAKQLLDYLGEEKYSYPISRIAEVEKLQNGDLPIPLFSLVHQEPHHYEWLEISPFETGSDYLSAYVPQKGFGSSYVAGELSFRHPEVTLGQLFGMCSAVFCLTIHRLWKEIILAYELHPLPVEPDATQAQELEDDQPKPTPRRNTITTPRPAMNQSAHEIPVANLQNTLPGDLAISLLQLFDHPTPHDEPLLVRDDDSSSDSDESIFEEDKKHPKRRKKVRIARKLERRFNKSHMAKKFLVRPGTVPNFAFGLANPMKRVKFLQLIDAGMDFCIPFPPLMREERNAKVIIVVDMSAPPDCVEGNSLQASIKWAQNHGYQVPDAHYDCVREDGNIFVFISDHPKAPTIIYIPLRKNPEYGDFDPVENYAEGGYCSTSSLSMTPEQIEELSGLFRCTFKSVDPIVKKAILETFSQMQPCSL